MGMPKLKSDKICLKTALSNIIQSVALMEASLSHILNAEGEKLQSVLGTLKDGQKDVIAKNAEELLKFNTSVEEMMNSATLLEVLLTKKLTLANGMIKNIKEDDDCKDDDDKDDEGGNGEGGDEQTP